jgi:1,4-alpha-glucan branching enzyme
MVFKMRKTPYSQSLSKELQLFHEGKSIRAYHLLGSFPAIRGGQRGAIFHVWAPNAVSVSVTGSFNQWDRNANIMERISKNGVWEAFFSGIKKFDLYKYSIETADGRMLMKADPYATMYRRGRKRPRNFFLSQGTNGRTMTGYQIRRTGYI